MKAYIFPGQGAQFSGMGLELYEASQKAKDLFHHANDLLGFEITKTMFEGTSEELKETKVTQPAIFLHATILAEVMGDRFNPDMVAGHSLGELSALVANRSLAFGDGLQLVYKRALAMQKACELTPSTMAAVLGLEDAIVEQICLDTPGIVVAANYNCPGQLVISGTLEAVTNACESLKEAGARRALLLPVGGAFHSPLMEPARAELASAIEGTIFSKPACAIYQNVNAAPVTDADQIKTNLISQLTGPVKWSQSVQNMIKDGANHFIEVGPGNVLQGLVKKSNREVKTEKAVM
jgi:[acyl-carrier-protein] S-malonyltransferase